MLVYFLNTEEQKKLRLALGFQSILTQLVLSITENAMPVLRVSPSIGFQFLRKLDQGYRYRHLILGIHF